MTEYRHHEWYRPDWLTPNWVRCKVCGTVKLSYENEYSCPGPMGVVLAIPPDQPDLRTTGES